MVESASDDILNDAQNVDVAFLVVGDPFGYVSFFLSTLQMLTRSQGNYTYRSRPARTLTQYPGS
jgi:diphthine synthase